MENNSLVLQEIQAEANQYGIEPAKVEGMVGNLPQIQAERKVLAEQYNEILKLDIENPETAKRAREIRLKIRDNRTKGLAVWHKTTKEYFLKGGQFVDAIKRKEEAENVRMEEQLESIERYELIKKEQERIRIREERGNLIAPYKKHVPSQLDLATMEEQEFNNLLKMVKTAHESEEREREEQERQRMKEEAIIKLQSERISFLYQNNLAEYISKEVPNDLASLSEEQFSAVVHEAQMKRQEKMEQDELMRQEFERLQTIAEEERKKAEAERKEMQERFQKQEAERKRLEAELKAKQEAERAAEEAEKKRLKKLKNASDKVLLIEFAKQFEPITDNISKVPVKGDEAKFILNEVEKYMTKVKAYILEKAEQL